MSKAVKFFNSKAWDRGWYIIAIALAVVSSVWSFHESIISGDGGWKEFLVITTFIQTVLGYIVVNSFAGRKGKFGSKVGLFDYALGTFNYAANGSPGNMFTSMYSFGLFTWKLFGKKKIQDDMKITGVNFKQLITTGITALFGAVLIVVFQDTLIAHGVPTWVVVANIATFVLALANQYLQASGVFICMPLRILQSSVDFCVQLFNVFIIGNFAAIIYASKDVMYLANNVKGIFVWSDSYKQTKLQEKNEEASVTV